MSTTWLTKLEALQGNWRNSEDICAEVEKVCEKDFQWLNDVVAEAENLFKKEKLPEVDQDKTKEDGDDTLTDNNQCTPVLLPQTPRVKNARNARRKPKSMRRSSSFGVNANTLASKRSTRTASKLAVQKISANVEKMNNLCKKLRRPTNANGVSMSMKDDEEEEVENMDTNSTRVKFSENIDEKAEEEEEGVAASDKDVDSADNSSPAKRAKLDVESQNGDEDMTLVHDENDADDENDEHPEEEEKPKSSPDKNETFDKTSPAKNETFDRTSPAKNETFDKTSPTVNETFNKTSPAKNETFDKTSPANNETFDKTSPTRNETFDKTSPAKNETFDKTSPAKNETFDKTSLAKSVAKNETFDKSSPEEVVRRSTRRPLQESTNSQNKSCEEIAGKSEEIVHRSTRKNPTKGEENVAGEEIVRRSTRKNVKSEKASEESDVGEENVRQSTRKNVMSVKGENDRNAGEDIVRRSTRKNVDKIAAKNVDEIGSKQPMVKLMRISGEEISSRVSGDKSKKSSPENSDGEGTQNQLQNVKTEEKPVEIVRRSTRKNVANKSDGEGSAPPAKTLPVKSKTATDDESDAPIRRSTRNVAKKATEKPTRVKETWKQKNVRSTDSEVENEATSSQTESEDDMPLSTRSKKFVGKSTLSTKGKSVSAASLRSQTAAQLNMLVSASKAPSTSSLLLAKKTSKADNSVHSSGGGRYGNTPGSSSTYMSKFRSRLMGVRNASPIKSATKKPPSNLLGLKSFLPSKPAKPTPEELIQQKEEELRKKKEREADALKRKEEMARAKVEEKRQQREARQKRVQEVRMAQEKESMLAKKNKEKEHREKVEALNKLKEAKVAEAEHKRLENEKRIVEAEERRKREEAELQEKRRQEEEKRRQEEEKRRREEEEKRRREEEKRRREEEVERKARAQQEAERKAKAQQEAERKAKAQEEVERKAKALQEAEQKRKREEEVRMQKERIAKLKEQSLAKTAMLNQTFEKADKSQLNSTYTAETKSVDSYDITPARHELPPEPLKDEDNYDIGDLKSDEDTDDEDNPRKIIPKWAMGSAFRMSLMHQCYNPPDVDLIFEVMEYTPDLSEIFLTTKRRFFKRTSSAVWGKAPVSHKY